MCLNLLCSAGPSVKNKTKTNIWLWLTISMTSLAAKTGVEHDFLLHDDDDPATSYVKNECSLQVLHPLLRVSASPSTHERKHKKQW